MQIEHRLDNDPAVGLGAISLREEYGAQKEQKRYDHRHSGTERTAARALEDRLVVDRIHEIVQREQTRQKQHGQTQRPVAPVGQSFQTVPRRGPARYGSIAASIGYVEAVDRKVGTREQRRHGNAQKQGASYAVDLQEGFVGPLAQQIRRLAAELVGYGLYDEYEQNGEPHVACAAEAGRVEQRERREECAAECHQRRECRLPLAAEHVDDHRALALVASYRIQKPLTALHEEQEHEQRPQKRYHEPPVVLKKLQGIHIVTLYRRPCRDLFLSV